MLSRHYPWILYPVLPMRRRHPAEALSAFQERRLKTLVAHAFERVPLYRERYNAAGVDFRIRLLPKIRWDASGKFSLVRSLVKKP